MPKIEIRLAGVGGQGLILAGLILAEASAIFDNKFVSQTQSYAPLARGAPSKSELIISDKEIDYPEVEKADLFLALSQDAYDKYINDLKENGIAIIDKDLVTSKHFSSLITLPLTEIAVKSTGKSFSASITALGVIAALGKFTSYESLIKSIKKNVPKGTEELNLKAFKSGFSAFGKY